VHPKDPRFTLAFERRMLDQLQAPDGNERDLVSAFFVKYAEAYAEREAALWVRMCHLLDLYRQGVVVPFVVDPILQFYAARFQAAKCDLNDVLKTRIFWGSILPLLSSQHLLSWADKLTPIIETMSARDAGLAAVFIKQIIKKWPMAASSKFVAWMQWTNDLLEFVPSKKYQSILKPLISLYAELGRSACPKIVEASFRIWSNPTITGSIASFSSVLFPIVFPVVAAGISSLDRRISNQCQAMMKTLEQIDPAVYGTLKARYRGRKSVVIDEAISLKASKWVTVAKYASAFDASFPLQAVTSAAYQFFGVGEAHVDETPAVA
jgi:hypothetical protein